MVATGHKALNIIVALITVISEVIDIPGAAG